MYFPQKRTPILYRASSGEEENYLTADTMTWVTHTRTGHATMFDSTGKLTWAPNNIETSTADLGGVRGGSITKTNSSDFTAPVSGGNVAKCVLEAAQTSCQIYFGDQNAFAVSGNLIQSVYFHRQAGAYSVAESNLKFRFGGTNMDPGYYDIPLSDLITTPTNPNVQYVGSGWYRLFASVTANGSSGEHFLGIIYDSGSSDGADAFYFADAQIERVTYQTEPRDYQLTTGSIYYGPRFDYNPATLARRGLLREMSRTNVVLYNRDLTNAAWTKTNVTAAKDQTGIDGVSNSASKITATAGNGTCLQAITLGSSARYQSCWVKRVTGSGTVEMTMDNGSTWTAITVTGSWTRVAIPTQTLANPTVGFRIVTDTDAIAIDMVQNEDGTNWTSEISTTSASVTRAADDLTAALYTGDSVTEYYRLVSDLSQSSRTVNPFSGVTDETDSVWIEKFTKP